MASRPTALYHLVKWLVLPCGMAALGYFAIAPRVKSPFGEAKPAPVAVTAPDSESAPSVDAPSKGPDVDVEVAPVKPAEPVKPRKRRKRTSPKPANPSPPVKTEEAPPAASPPETDPAGSGGTEPPVGNGDSGVPPDLAPDPIHRTADTARVRFSQLFGQ